MKKFDNFCRALDNLGEIYRYEAPYDTVVLTGLVGLYQICFEQSWKAIKEVLTDQGFPESQTGSPKQILKTAHQAGMIADQEAWLLALAARNNVAHAYNQDVALDIVKQARAVFYPMFCQLRDEVRDRWLG